MSDLEHTWLVECFAPGIDDAAVAAAADRVRAAVEVSGDGVTYLGALLMAEDEVVFHAFRAMDAGTVRDVSAAAGLQFERVVESVGVLPGNALGGQLADQLIRAGLTGAVNPD